MIVILTALQVEHQAVLEHMTGTEVHRHAAGTLFDVGSLGCRPHRRVALGVTGPGALTAAALTERAFTEFSPSAMLFVGVAGGLRDWLEIGDVVVATKVYAYHGGRSEDDEFLARPRAWEASHALEQVARRLPRDDAWRFVGGESMVPHDETSDNVPSVHFEPVAAGDVLLNSKVSPLAQQIRGGYNDAIAIEMESSGFALAGHLSGKVPMLTVRGVSDMADGTKAATDREGGQRVAARNAAAFAVALAAALEEETGRQEERSSSVPSSIRTINKASGNARVGQQVGINLGGISTSQLGEHR
ncbi:Nucleoside phosphorylase [Amycolatopsis marina]|uniref:Nucleoside phosphorylase n=1 Tax=Amycolatopsis marina TaxID=490629 RepID=A0A1I1BFG7_9PSEU|nr:5'-methylthioadenosine/S-adenosylhomocysteine nucleosidase [Amycolatopsis marina]SFB48492.1 Nucleoside phosphorylase [Amycolatopsis marina]